MKIMTYCDNESLMLIRLNVEDDTISFIGKDNEEHTYTPLEAMQISDVLRDLCQKTRHFQGEKGKCI